jgi:hypothetical protein
LTNGVTMVNANFVLTHNFSGGNAFWKSLQNRSAGHRLGAKRGIFQRAEGVLGAPKAGETTFAEISFHRLFGQ